jgi:hypothetical protein
MSPTTHLSPPVRFTDFVLISRMCVTCTAHIIVLALITETFGGIRIMKLLITQYSPSSSYLLHLRAKYSPQDSVLKHPLSPSSPKRTAQVYVLDGKLKDKDRI